MTRNGRDVLTEDRAALTIPQVIEGMIGTQQKALFPPRAAAAQVLRVTQLVVAGLTGGEISDVSFTARSGEVVGLAGLEGSGVSSLLGTAVRDPKGARRRGDLSGRAWPARAPRPRRRGAASASSPPTAGTTG